MFPPPSKGRIIEKIVVAVCAAAFGVVSNTTFAQETKNFTMGAAYISNVSVYSEVSLASRFAPSVPYESVSYTITMQDGLA